MNDCLDYGGDWNRMDSHFDEVGGAMTTIFKIALTEGWLDIMWHGMDGLGQPGLVKGYNVNPYWSIYYSIIITVAAFFLLNLFDGVVIDNYSTECDCYVGIGDFTPGQRLWI